MPPPEDTRLLILYDGVCVFCDHGVRWLMDRDPRAVFHFAPLQGGTAAQLRERHREIPEELDTLVVVETRGESERVFLRSASLLRIVAELPTPWRWLRAFDGLPTGLLDLLYRAFARVRYRVFGRMDACRVPTADERARILP
jgi:predicted DCC family thiol-disulfide oxidoreductase YuxK